MERLFAQDCMSKWPQLTLTVDPNFQSKHHSESVTSSHGKDVPFTAQKVVHFRRVFQMAFQNVDNCHFMAVRSRKRKYERVVTPIDRSKVEMDTLGRESFQMRANLFAKMGCDLMFSQFSGHMGWVLRGISAQIIHGVCASTFHVLKWLKEEIQLGPIYTWRRICRRSLDEVSTNSRRSLSEGFFFAGEVFLRRIFNLILIFFCETLYSVIFKG